MIPLLIAQFIGSLGFLICLVALFGEYSNAPSRNHFCVMTKIPTEILAVELPLAAWSAPWYGAATLIIADCPRLIFYFGVIHTAMLSYAMLTLYNSLREIDKIDAGLLLCDVLLFLKSLGLLVTNDRLTEASAVLLVVAIIWFSALGGHADHERREGWAADRERRGRSARGKRASAEYKRRRDMGSAIEFRNERRRPRELGSINSTLLR